MTNPNIVMALENKLDRRTSELCRILNGLGQMPYTKEGQQSFAMGALRATTDTELDEVIAALKDALAGVMAELDAL